MRPHVSLTKSLPACISLHASPCTHAHRYQIEADDETARVFLGFDHDRSGSIDARELVSALSSLGLQCDSRHAQQVLNRYDLDRSGVLELPEFRLLVDELKRFQVRTDRARR